MQLTAISTNLIHEIQNRQENNFVNKILYEMCEKYPLHNNQDEINGKLMAIGRIYAAALERTRTNIFRFEGYDIYGATSKKIIDDKILDNKIEELKKFKKIDDSIISKVLETHKYLTNVFKEKTGQEKRSLASKYLHFHARDLFFIYDSIAAKQINALLKIEDLDKNNKDLTKQPENDIEYAKFYNKLFKLQTHIKEKFNVLMTPREIDRLLLGY
jgi:hypothetical protein